MSDSDSGVLTYRSGSTIICAKGPKTTNMSVQSSFYNPCLPQRPMINGRSGSPMSVRTIDSNASMSARDLASILKNRTYTSKELSIIKDAYKKIIKSHVRKKAEKRINRTRRHIKKIKQGFGDHSGELGSDSSISSGGSRTSRLTTTKSMYTGFRDDDYYNNSSSDTSTKTNLTDIRKSIKHNNLYKDCTDSLKQKSFKNIFSNAKKTVNNVENPKTSSKLTTQQDRFKSSFLLPCQRFKKTPASVTVAVEQDIRQCNTEDNIFKKPNISYNSRHTNKPLLNTNQVNGEKDMVTLQEKAISNKNKPIETFNVDNLADARNKVSTPIKSKALWSYNTYNRSELKSNKLNKDCVSNNDYTELEVNKCTNDFEFAKPHFPVRKVINTKTQEILIAKSAQPILDEPTKSISQSNEISQPIVLDINNAHSDTMQSNTSDATMRPSFMKRKLFTQTLDVTESKDLITDSVHGNSPQAFNAKDKHRTRKLVTVQSCLSRDVDKENNNVMNLLQKLVPSKQMNSTVTSKKSDLLLAKTMVTNEKSKSKAVESKENNWDITSIISTCNNSDMSDTYTDEEIFVVHDKTKVQKEKSVVKNCRVMAEKVDLSTINKRCNKTKEPSPVKITSVNPKLQIPEQNKSELKKLPKSRYQCIESFWNTDVESDMDTSYAMRDYKEFPSEKEITVLNPVENTIRQINTTCKIQATSKQTDPKQNNKPIADNNRPVLKGKGLRQNDVTFSSEKPTNKLEDNNNKKKYVKQKNKTTKKECKPTSNQIVNRITRSRNTTDLSLENINFNNSLNSTIDLNFNLHKVNNVGVRTRRRNKEEQNAATTINRTLRSRSNNKNDTLEINHSMTLRKRTPKKYNKQECCGESSRTTQAKNERRQIFKDCTDSLKQKSFKNIFSNAKKTVNNVENPKTSSKLTTQQDRFKSSFLLPCQRFKKTPASVTVAVEQDIRQCNTEDNIFKKPNISYNSRHTNKPLLNTNQVNGEKDMVTLQEKAISNKNKPIETFNVDNLADARNKVSTPIKSKALWSYNTYNRSELKSNKLNKDCVSNNDYTELEVNKCTNDFEFAKPHFPVRKVINTKTQEILIAKSAQPILDEPTKSISQSNEISQPIVLDINNAHSDTMQSNTSDATMRPSFMKRKLFTQTLDVTESKDLITDSVHGNSPQAFNAKDKHRTRKLVTVQSCLSRDVDKENNNVMNLLQKLVPSKQMNSTVTSKKSDLLLAKTMVTNEKSKSKAVESKENNWDITSIISTCNNSDMSDTYTDEEIFVVHDKTKVQKEKSVVKNCRVMAEKVDLSTINKRCNKTKEPSPVKITSVNPKLQIPEQNKSELKKLPKSRYQCIESFWNTDVESDMDTSYAMRDYKEFPSEKEITVLNPVENTIRQINTTCKIQATSKQTDPKQNNKPIADNNRPVLKGKGLRQNDVTFSSEKPTNKLEDNNNKKKYVKQKNKTTKKECKPTSNQIVNRITRSRNTTDLSLENINFNNSLNSTIDLNFNLHKVNNVGVRTRRRNKEEQNAATTINRTLRSRSNNKNDTLEINHSMTLRKRTPKKYNKQECCGESSRTTQAKNERRQVSKKSNSRLRY